MLGANEVPPTGSLGTGTLTGTYDDTTNQLSWNISWINLGALTGMHFHGPAAPNFNAGVQVGIPGLGSPSIGNTNILAAQEADLLGDLFYLNLHTQAFPGGEIRGQVLCDPIEVIGGEIIPIAATSLILAGMQTNFSILTALVAVGSGAFVALYYTTKRKQV